MKIKLLLFTLFFGFVFLGYSKTYYISNTGNDNNDGLTVNSPWKTINKVNNRMNTFVSGDVIAFKSGNIFYGFLTINNKNNLRITSYGSGAKPILSGGERITNWSRVNGSNVWSANVSREIFQLFDSDKVMPNGRIPEFIDDFANSKNYFIVSKVTGTKSFISNGLKGNQNLVGATAHVFSQPWRISSIKIIGFNGATGEITLEDETRFDLTEGDYLFINNHRSLLKSQNDWYYNPNLKRIFVYSSQAPQNITGSTSNVNGITIFNSNNLTVEGLNIKYFAKNGIDTKQSNYLKILDNDIEYCYEDGIFNTGGINPVMSGNMIKGSNFVGILCRNDGSIIENNLIQEIGLLKGITDKGSEWTLGIETYGINAKIRRNKLLNMGYSGIKIWGKNTIVERNFIENYCLVKHDGGGIYAWNESFSQVGSSGSLISKNIIIGVDFKNDKWSSNGIHMDDHSHGITITENSILTPFYGIMMHNCRNHIVKNNNIYKATNFPIRFNESWQAGRGQMFGNKIENNNIYIEDMYITPFGIVSQYDTWDFAGYIGNKYFNPYNNASVSIRNSNINGGQSFVYNRMNLNMWQQFSGEDNNAKANNFFWNDYNLNKKVGGNLISNSEFANGVTGWTGPNTNKAILTKNGVKFLKATVTSTTNGRLRSANFNIDSNTSYLIEFDAESTNMDVYYIRLVKTDGSYQVIGETFQKDIRKGVNSYSIPFESAGSHNNVKLEFLSYGKGSIIQVAKVKLTKAIFGTLQERSTFVYNEKNAQQSVFLPNGYWEDLSGNGYDGSVNLQPNTSKILILKNKPIGSVIAEAGPDVTICEGESTVLSASGGSSYKWSTGQTTKTITVSPESTKVYSVEVSDGTSKATDEVQVTVNTINASAGSDVTIELGEKVQLTATGGTRYVWQGGVEKQSIIVSPPKTRTYDVTVYKNGCSEIATVLVKVGNESGGGNIEANAGPDVTICEGETTTLTASGGSSYKWSSGQTSRSISVSPNSTRVYSVEVSDGTSKATDEVQVTVNTINANAGSDVTINLGEKVRLTATGGNRYVWQGGVEKQSITVSPPKTRTYFVTVYKNGCSEVDEVRVVVNNTLAKVSSDVGNSTDSFSMDESDNQKPENLDFVVFPNPSIGVFNIQANIDSFELRIYNLSNQLLHSKKHNLIGNSRIFQIDLTSFAQGIYILQIFDSQNSLSKKIVKN